MAVIGNLRDVSERSPVQTRRSAQTHRPGTVCRKLLIPEPRGARVSGVSPPGYGPAMAMKALSKATIYQVAQLAGVSIATVSRALRESDLVTEQTRERVRAAAKQLNFTPSRSARSLAEGRHAANGIVFPDLVGPYYAEVVLG